MTSSILNAEINEQPEVISELLNSENENVAKIAQSLAGKFDYVLIAARGTSDNAARYAQYVFGAYNQLQVALATPSLFSIYSTPPNLAHALVVGISQSGQSPDIVSVLDEAKKQGRPTLAITNKEESPLAQTADFVIPLHAHAERAVAATKSYTTSLTALAMLSCHLAGDNERLRELLKIPVYVQKTLDMLQPAINRVERYRYIHECNVIGRGFNYSTAFEVALKIKELTRIVAEPYSSADFRHGPIATVTPGFPVVLIIPSGAVTPDMTDLVQRLEQRQAEMLIISEDQALLAKSRLPLPIPAGLPEWLTPMVTVLPGQLFGMRLAIERGLNADQPEGLTKVTETR